MKISVLLFSLLVGICLALGIVLMTEAPEGAAGVGHPQYSSMLRGGDGAARLAPVRLISRILGVLLILFFVSLLALGARSKKSFPTEKRALWIGTLVYVAFFLAMTVAYDTYAQSGSDLLVLSFPPPTALMLYGVGFTPLVFVFLYMLRFDPWILDDDELGRFLEETARKTEE